MTQEQQAAKRKRQRDTLAALDIARLDLAGNPDNQEFRKAYDDAVSAYWSCRNVRNSKRAGIRVT